MGDHLHIPRKIVVGHDLNYAALAECWCGQVAYLENWAKRPWLKTNPGMSFALQWSLGEHWRDPDEFDKNALKSDSLLLPPE